MYLCFGLVSCATSNGLFSFVWEIKFGEMNPNLKMFLPLDIRQMKIFIVSAHVEVFDSCFSADV